MDNKTVAAALLAGAFSWMVASSVLAQTSNALTDREPSRRTAGYVQSRLMLEAMYRLGLEQDRQFGLQPQCGAQYLVKLSKVSVVSPIELADDKPHPTKGIWLSRYQFERCGETKYYNATFVANGNGEPPKASAYHPGATNAGPVLLNDAMRSALIGAMVRYGNGDCKEVDVFDMRVSESPHDVADGDKTFKGVWTEVWTFRMCRQMIDVPMTFVPDGKGGTRFFSAGAKMGEARR